MHVADFPSPSRIIILLRAVAMPLRSLLSAVVVCLAIGAQAQQIRLSGTLTDSLTNEALPFVPVTFQHLGDTTVRRTTQTDISGYFVSPLLDPGSHRLTAAFLGYRTLVRQVTAISDTDLGTMRMAPATTLLHEAVIEQLQTRVEQKGDTTIYNAGAFQVLPDATAEELLRRMPGITTDGGEVKAQGEKVKRVLVDGEEFFGDDALMTLRNLPAEIIDKVQVFDRLNEQSEFSGFDDGNREKTINIITKAGRNQGTFGTAQAGYGTDERYAASLSLNRFKGSQRITVLGMLNNINQQNFSSQDLVGVQGGGGGGGRGGGRGGGAADLMIGTQPGINTTGSAGLNYSDKFGKNTKLSGSYFFNQQQSRNTSLNERTTFLSDTAAQYSTSRRDRNSDNYNHRFNLRFEHAIDSLRSVVVTPRLSFQLNRSTSSSSGLVRNEEGDTLSSTENINRNQREGLDFSNSLLYRQKGRVKGRTFSANLTMSLNNQGSLGRLHADNRYSSPMIDDAELDQRSDGENRTQRHALELQYTEPVGSKGHLRFVAAPSIQLSDADKLTYDDADGTSLLNTRLSNRADNTIRSLRGGVAYRMKGEKYNFNVGLDGMGTDMHSEQTYPRTVTVERTFMNALPNAMFMWRPDKLTRVRLNYRTNTRTPSITQLQNVVDNSDPLKLTTGNLDLSQGYMHTVSLNLNTSDSTRTRPLLVMLMAQAEQDRISNVTFAPATDSTLADGTVLPAGSQLTIPMNLQGHFSTRALVNYGLPVPAIGSNANLTAGGSIDRLPGTVNGITSFTWNTNWNIGASISGMMDKVADFRLSYTANFNTARSELRPDRDNAYYQGRLTGRVVLSMKGWVLENEVAHDQYIGLGQDIDRDALVWNAALGRKFLKGDALELRITAYDLLGRNVSVGRDVGDTYIQNTVTNMLQRYVMFSVIHNLRAFTGGKRTAPGEGD